MQVHIPTTYLPERTYIIDVLFSVFLGLDYEITIHEKSIVLIRTADNNKVLTIEDILFQTPTEQWLSKNSLPVLPLQRWNVKEDFPEATVCQNELPILYGKPLFNGRYFYRDGDELHLGLDIFGSSFFMLTRYEEMVIPERDEHQRFSARSSIAYREGFLGRPLVNEYLEVLWAAMNRLWPGLRRKSYDYKVALSHDVDWPFITYGIGWYLFIRQIAGDVLKRRDFDLASKRLKCKIKNNPKLDPANTFDFIMKTSERFGIVSEFYFITDHTAGFIDGQYYINNPEIKKLILEIHKRGHRIGLHASYNSFRDPNQTKKELKNLLKTAEELRINQDCWGGRQHYLRWENPTTWQNWEEAGLDYDSTVGYADHVGFRTGICYEYPVFNLQTRKMLHLWERPLIIMEGTLLGGNYMNLQPKDALEQIERLASICYQFKGMFTLLWHNSSLIENWQKCLYEEAVKAVK